MKPPKSLAEEEAYWYARLREEGFPEIENTRIKGRPLVHYHSREFKKVARVRRKIVMDRYMQLAEDFFYSPGFEDACEWVTRHGNSRFTPQEVRDIWEFHLMGHTDRRIADEMRRSKTCVNKVLRKLKEWMELI